MHVYKSNYEDVDLPRVDILTLLFDSAWCRAEEETRIHTSADRPENGVTKREARNLVQQIAYTFRRNFGIGGHRPGQDVVLSTSSLNPFLPILFYGIMAAGGVYSGASTAFTVSELVRQIRDSNARLLLCSAEYEERTLAAAKECGIPADRILIIDAQTPKKWRLLPSLSPQTNILSNQSLDWPRITSLRDLEDTTVCLLYSSGTTGLPKGVRLSHWNLVTSNICSMQVGARYIANLPDDKPFKWRTLACLPMAHIAGIQQFSINPFYMGGTTYWMQKYDFDKFIEYTKKYQTTYQFSVPPIWLQVAKSEKVTTSSGHFSALEVACSGAAPMGLELVKEISGKLGGVWMTQTWGTTETDGSITATDWDVKDESGAVGGIIPNVKLRVVDDDGKDVKPGEVGEMLVNGPVVCQGYHNNEKATREAFKDGFYCTGDVGYIKNGLVYLVDRKKELIKYKGLQVAPAELEDLLMGHGKVKDAAVIGVQSEKFGTEVPKAFVVPSEGKIVTEQELIAFVKKNLASHKQLRGGVEFIDEIPKSASGKILRKELRQRPYVEDPKARL